MAEALFRITLIAVGAVLYFPGGTILMALSCDSRKLDGWDWVLSVVIPGFGVVKTIFSSSCFGFP
ncbi:MAG: hypothetical protein JKP98_24250 [Rhodobacteraceae bacterium]|jgi:hypothetical protein|nr:hypothetical protein [Paracoccaceae bacterium]MBL4559051.1 hypothetical protein [Paracoccaceae bacterium]